MKLSEYFKETEGVGVLATADAHYIISVIISLTYKCHIAYSFSPKRKFSAIGAKQQFGTAEAGLPPNCS